MNLRIPLHLGLVAMQVLLAGCGDSDRRLQPVSRTELIDAAEVVPVVVAAGTLKPVGEVELGSEVSGRITALLVDFNAVVRENDVIARIDPQAFHAQVQQAEAALLDARATAMMREAALRRASRSLRRISNLQSKEAASEDALDRAQTEVQMARAEVQQARAVVRKREAALQEAEVALSRTVIRSPINGVVISREVARGQTVAASLEAPRLFTIARTLSEMEIHARIDEADIGQIRTGQRATFTVAAHGDRDFDAHVVQVRVAPEIVENVVTYTVVLLAENEDESLLPGMTAITEIEVQSAADEVQKLASTAAPRESRSREGLAEALRESVERNPPAAVHPVSREISGLGGAESVLGFAGEAEQVIAPDPGLGASLPLHSSGDRAIGSEDGRLPPMQSRPTPGDLPPQAPRPALPAWSSHVVDVRLAEYPTYTRGHVEPDEAAGARTRLRQKNPRVRAQVFNDPTVLELWSPDKTPAAAALESAIEAAPVTQSETGPPETGSEAPEAPPAASAGTDPPAKVAVETATTPSPEESPPYSATDPGPEPPK